MISYADFVIELSALSSKFLMKILNRLKPRADPHGAALQITVLFDSQPSIIGLSVQYFMHPPYGNYSKTIFPLFAYRKVAWNRVMGLKKLKIQPTPCSPLLHWSNYPLKGIKMVCCHFFLKNSCWLFFSTVLLLRCLYTVSVSRPPTLSFILVSFHVELTPTNVSPSAPPFTTGVGR